MYVRTVPDEKFKNQAEKVKKSKVRKSHEMCQGFQGLLIKTHKKLDDLILNQLI